MSGDVKGDMNVLLAVLERVPGDVKRLSRLDFEESSRFSVPEILLDGDMGPASGEATVGYGSQDVFALSFDFSPVLASNGIPRIPPGVCGCLSQSFCFPSCFGDVYGGNVARVSDRLWTDSLGTSNWAAWARALRAVSAW